MLRQDIAGRPCSVHAHAEMAIADYPVQLPVRQIDEPFGFAACVVFQPGGTEQGAQKATEIAELSQRTTDGSGLGFGFAQRGEEPLRIALEEFSPT